MTLPDRPDLRAMGPEVLAAATNLGLVKRATRDLAEGRVPVLTADGATIHGRFDDGAEVCLPAGGAPTTCTCGAVTCRHRIATILAYRDAAAAAGASPSALPALPEVSADALERSLGPKRFAAARALLEPQIVVDVLPATAADPIPTARLPQATVRFLSADALAGIRCDCKDFAAAAADRHAASPVCVHAAVGLWAFDAYRRLFGGAAQAAEKVTLTPAVGEAEAPLPPPPAAPAPDAYAPFAALIEHLLHKGVVGSPDAFATLASAVRGFEEARTPRWLVLAVAELVAQVDAYAHRSARYEAGRVAAIAGEIVGRIRAGGDDVLGIGLAAETKVARTRLLSLGVRTFAEGDDRRAEIAFVDPESSTILLFEKIWDIADSQEIQRRPILPRTPLATLAEGQLITDAAIRHADGTIRFSVGRGAGATSVLPQAGDWGRLSSRLVVRDFAAALAARLQGIPRFLGPRTRTETLAIVAGFSVESVVYVAEEQAVLGTVVDAGGAPLFVRRRHAAVAPSALPILGTLLPRATFIAGDLRAEAGRLVLDPTAVVAEGRVHALDTSAAPPAPAPLPTGSALAGDGRLDRLQRFVEDLVHGGLGRRRDAQVAAGLTAADALEAGGYLQTAQKIRAWARAPEDREAFFDLLVLAAVARES